MLSEIPDDPHAHEGFRCTSLTNTQSDVLDSSPPWCHCLYHGYKLPARVPSPSFSLCHPHNAQVQNNVCTTDPPSREYLLDTCRAVTNPHDTPGCGSFAIAVSQMMTLRLSTVRQLSRAFQQVLMANKAKIKLSVASPEKKVIQMQPRGIPSVQW